MFGIRRCGDKYGLEQVSGICVIGHISGLKRREKNIDKTVPFMVHTRHPDGGVELINEAILAYAREHGIRYVRSRPYHKNDNPAVESRHFTLVRSYIGYRRYNTDEEYKFGGVIAFDFPAP